MFIPLVFLLLLAAPFAEAKSFSCPRGEWKKTVITSRRVKTMKDLETFIVLPAPYGKPDSWSLDDVEGKKRFFLTCVSKDGKKIVSFRIQSKRKRCSVHDYSENVSVVCEII